MGEVKDRIIRLIEQEAAAKVAAVAGEYVRTKPDRKEALQAAIQVERWLAKSCRDCLDD
ncbi:MAG: hypothetical protein ACYTAS_16985 [Planctomycetota bacterium]|jgi:hypothetical protein